MSRILIIEDEEAIADLEKDYLELSGFEVEIENRGDTGLVRAMKEEFDLIILDLMLPEVDGFDICRQVREEKNTPIIMVSAKKDDIDKIRGLGLGADDYMTKPFSPSELVARVKAHMERYNRLVGSNVHKNDVIEIRGIKIDKTARRVWVNGEETTFTTKEFDLLTFLAENPNRVFTKEELFREIWDMESVGDIATVKIGGKSPKLGTASERTKPAVLITVTKQPDTSTEKLTEKLDEIVVDLRKNLPADVHVSTDIFRQSHFIDNSINNVKKSLFEGSFFVVIVLFLFLMNIRTTVISLVALPLSLLVSIIVLHYMGLTINTMSLGGMAIAIGSLVDDAIVDVENVYKRIRENRLLPPDQQRSTLEVVYDASREVRMPILNSTLIIVVSFVPLFFLSGMEGRMLVPLGIAFIVALFASTVVALTLTPVLCSYLLNRKATGMKELREAWIARKLKVVYKRALELALAYQKWVLGTTIALFVVALVIFFHLGRSFLPPFNEGSFTINVSSLPGISLDESDQIGRRAEALLLQVPEIKTVARKTGRAELDEHALGVNVSEIEAPFELQDRSRDEVMNDVRKKLSTISGANIEIGQPISHRIDAMLSGTEANIAIKLFGTDLNLMFTVGNQIKAAIQTIPGLVDLKVEQQIERPQLTITPKRELLAKYGIPLPEFEEYINVMLGGEAVSQVYDDGKSFDLTVKTSDASRATMDDISNLMIDAAGQKVPLSYVADIRSVTGPNTINRENVQRKIVISANVSERDLRSVVNEISSEAHLWPLRVRSRQWGSCPSSKMDSSTFPWPVSINLVSSW